jgi:hypothetical protein
MRLETSREASETLWSRLSTKLLHAVFWNSLFLLSWARSFLGCVGGGQAEGRRAIDYDILCVLAGVEARVNW